MYILDIWLVSWPISFLPSPPPYILTFICTLINSYNVCIIAAVGHYYTLLLLISSMPRCVAARLFCLHHTKHVWLTSLLTPCKRTKLYTGNPVKYCSQRSRWPLIIPSFLWQCSYGLPSFMKKLETELEAGIFFHPILLCWHWVLHIEKFSSRPNCLIFFCTCKAYT